MVVSSYRSLNLGPLTRGLSQSTKEKDEPTHPEDRFEPSTQLETTGLDQEQRLALLVLAGGCATAITSGFIFAPHLPGLGGASLGAICAIAAVSLCLQLGD